MRLDEQAIDPFFVAQVREGRCVLFAGAGLSAAAGYPGWAALLEGITRAARREVPDLKTAGLDALVTENRLLEAAGYLRRAMGGTAFHAALTAELQHRPVAPSALHRLVARFRFRAIVTTNFDPLIEQAFDGALPVATQVDAADLARHLGDATPFVFKVHGDLARPDTIILTADEFARAMADNKALKITFNTLVQSSPLLFVGYSHADPDFDLFLREHVQVFGQHGARRYALMQVRDEKDAILQDLLAEKAITVLPYERHDEVPPFLERLLAAVEGPPAPMTREPEQPSLRIARALVDRGLLLRRKAREGRRLAVVLPGLLGSQLDVHDAAGRKTTVWLNPLRIALGSLSRLDLAAPDPPLVSAPHMLGMLSGRLVEALAAGREVLPFPYDWRLDMRENAAQLAEFLIRECPHGTDCDLVALDAGGLVARSFLATHGDEWRRLHGARGGRTVFIGTAHHGTFQALLMLLGRDPMTQLLGRLDLAHSAADVRRIVASFPSLYQMLPSPRLNAAWRALYEPASWGDVAVDARHLADGPRFHDEIAGAVDPERMVTVVGSGRPTVVSVGDPTRLAGQPQWAMDGRGDGVVSPAEVQIERDGRRVPSYCAPVAHADLSTDATVIRAVVELLDRGETALLQRVPTV